MAKRALILKIDDALLERARQYAARYGLSVADVMRVALVEFLDRREGVSK